MGGQPGPNATAQKNPVCRPFMDTTSPLPGEKPSTPDSEVDRTSMLGRRLRDFAAFAGALILLTAFPSSHALSASTGISVIGVATVRTTGATSLAVPRPTGTTPGMLLFAALTVRLASTDTVAAPSGWTLVQRTTNEGVGASLTHVVYVHLAASAEPGSYPWTFSSSAAAVGSMLALTGV